jgi:hypothetical protein
VSRNLFPSFDKPLRFTKNPSKSEEMCKILASLYFEKIKVAKRVLVKLGAYIKAPEPTSKASFITPSQQ